MQENLFRRVVTHTKGAHERCIKSCVDHDCFYVVVVYTWFNDASVVLKPHLHGRLLGARIDILPFFFLKSRRSLTRRKIQVRFALCNIARHAPKKSNGSTHSHGRDFIAMLAYDCNSQKSLIRWDYVPVILAKSSRRNNSRYRTGSLARYEIVSKRGLLVLNLRKPTAAEALQMRRLSAFAFETTTLRNFEKKVVWSQRKRKTK